MAGALHCLVYHDHQGFHSCGLCRRHSGHLQLVCTSCTVVCLAIRCCAVLQAWWQLHYFITVCCLLCRLHLALAPAPHMHFGSMHSCLQLFLTVATLLSFVVACKHRCALRLAGVTSSHTESMLATPLLLTAAAMAMLRFGIGAGTHCIMRPGSFEHCRQYVDDTGLAVKQPVPAARRFNSCTTLLLQKQSLQRLSAPAQVQRHCCMWRSLGSCVTTLSCMTLHVIAAAAACDQIWVHLLLSTMVAP